MPSAIALNSIAINVSRVGPAIAGLLVAAVGAWLVFVLNALHRHLAVLLRWRREHQKSAPAERFFSAIRVGLRFVMHTARCRWCSFAARILRVRGRDLVCSRSSSGRNWGPEIMAFSSRASASVPSAELLLPWAGQNLARCSRGRRECALRSPRAGASANIGLLAVAMLAWVWRGSPSCLHYRSRPNDAAGLGACTRIGRIRRHLDGRHGHRQRPVGPGRDADRHSRRADRGGAEHAGRHRIDLEIQAQDNKVLDFTPSMDQAAPVLAEIRNRTAGR
jgi:hypothetical protein